MSMFYDTFYPYSLLAEHEGIFRQIYEVICGPINGTATFVMFRGPCGAATLEYLLRQSIISLCVINRGRSRWQ